MALRDINVQPAVDSFEARKRIQKLGYILQKSGILPSYGYTWYLQGPYASELTSDLYEIVAHYTDFVTRNQGRAFTQAAIEKLERLRRILGPVMSNTQVLEAMASILYLGGKQEMLRSLKPALPDSVIEEARRRVQELQSEGVIENPLIK
jgi:uncharacterized protein YwgA